MAERILIADDDPMLRLLLEKVLEQHGFHVTTVTDGDALVRAAHESPPDLLLIDIMMPVMDGLEAIRQLRQDTRTAHLPMLLLTAHVSPQQQVSGFESGADDYITKPFHNDLLVARVRANLRRAARRPVNNPLTGLPGNVLIEEEVLYRLRNQRPFALLWIDLDNFKSFNDAYGFARGDRVIRLVGEILGDIKTARGNAEDFIGHIGGDDFVILTAPEDAADVSKRVIELFDAAIAELYDPDDLQRGYLTGVDRFGTPRRFPIVSLSIGIVDTVRRAFDSYDEVAKVAAEVKSRAKKAAGSSYVVDERRKRRPAPAVERRGRPPLILITCADEQLCAQLQTVVERQGSRVKTYDALVTANGSANDLISEQSNLIVLDAALPRAWQALAELRGRQPALPIIMIVAPGDEERALAAGAHAAVLAQVTSDQFLTTVAELLRLHGSSRPM
jgi:diguanylate cyclase (GGDEF)-like protein